MATTNVDIIKISQLDQLDRLTDEDHLLVNDHDPTTGEVETKKIFINDLAADISGRVVLDDLSGVEVSGAVIGNVLKYDGTNWVPAQDLVGEGGGGIALTDLSAVTGPVIPGENASLTYNSFQGIFNFTPPDLRVGNMDDVLDQAPTTGQFLRWGGSYWYPSSLDDAALIVENSLVPAGGGSLELEGDTLTYIPPDLSGYLTEEIDPIFSASAAASITYSDVANWNALLLPEADPGLDDLTDVNLGGRQLKDGMVLSYDEAAQLWWADYVPFPNLGDLKDVYTNNVQSGDILEYDGAQWRAAPNPSTSVSAGDGLIGGGQGNVVIHVNPGPGIQIKDDRVTLNANLENLTNVGGSNGTASTGDVLTWNGYQWTAQPADMGEGATYTINPGDGLNGGGTLVPGGTVSLRVNTGKGITTRQDRVELNAVLEDVEDVVGTNNASEGTYLKYSNGKWRPGAAPQAPSGGGGDTTVSAGAGIGVNKSGDNYEVRAKVGTGIKISGSNNIALDADLNNLNNVGGTPSDGDQLVWHANEGKWKPKGQEFGIKVWGCIEKGPGGAGGGGNDGKNEDWQIKNGSGNFVITNEDGYGRLRINFQPALPHGNYALNVTCRDSEGDHMSGIMAKTSTFAVIYQKDLQNYGTADSGRTDSQDSGQGFDFTVVY